MNRRNHITVNVARPTVRASAPGPAIAYRDALRWLASYVQLDRRRGARSARAQIYGAEGGGQIPQRDAFSFPPCVRNGAKELKRFAILTKSAFA